jgi:hypothetical protein
MYLIFENYNLFPFYDFNSIIKQMNQKIMIYGE